MRIAAAPNLPAVSIDDPTRFTTAAWWDDYWTDTPLPQKIGFGTSVYLDQLLAVLTRYLPSGNGQSVLEIGGAPGRYLAMMHERGLAVTALEYSPVGVELTKENFRRLGIKATVVHGDMFDASLDIAPQDAVYSLGLIEHFDDPAAVARAHMRLVNPGGILIIGAPNLQGLSRRLHAPALPSVLETHHWPATDPAGWSAYERELGLELLFKDYVGGSSPRCSGGSRATRSPTRSCGGRCTCCAIRSTRSRAAGLRKYNSRRWSGYVIAAYRVPA